MSYVFIFLILAAITKRAQIPFSAWLPAAIAAPTPVSSLVHSSTLVTAGVYLIIRFRSIIYFLNYLLVISLMTIFLSRLRAFYETDLKKVVALSTLRQLGIIMFSLSLGIKDLTFFHLISHALFKSLIFLCAGAFIHFFGNSQESRLAIKLPFYSTVFSVYFLFSNFSLMGLFFLRGFYSKDIIIERSYIFNIKSLIIFVLLLSVLLTIYYTLRLLHRCINLAIKRFRVLEFQADNVIMFSSMFILYLISLIGGSLITWVVFPLVCSSFSFFVKILVSILIILMLTFFSRFYLNLSNTNNLIVFLRKI